MTTLSIVVPAYNEASVLRATLQEITTFLEGTAWDWEARVVDDGSTDGTTAVVQQIAAANRRVVAQPEPHRGKGGAVRAGMLASTAAYRFLCDADLSMPIAELSRFLPPVLTDADVAIGSREGLGARRVGEPWIRHAAGRVFNTLVGQTMTPGIQDTQCGFKMFTAKAAETIFPKVTIEGWAFDIEVLYIAKLHGLRVREVPIEWHYRTDSRLRMTRDGLRMLREVRSIKAKARSGAYGTPRA